MTRDCAAVLLVLVAACSQAPEPEPAPTTTTTTHVMTAQELIALERTPGSTPPLEDAVEPATAPVPGLPGTPETSPAAGPASAPVRLYVFSDFQCPVCPRVVEPLKHLVRAHPEDIRVIFKQHALVSHARATRLAAASLAAFRQGKFWAMHDRVFAQQGRDNDAELAAVANALGLDLNRFEHDLDEEAVTAQVRYESALADKLGLESTPAFIVNGTPASGWGSYMGLDYVVQQELTRARKVAAGGVPADRVACEAMRQSGPRGEEMVAALCPAGPSAH